MRILSGVTDQYISYRCNKCGETKPEADFGIDRRQARGRKYACKECTNAERRGRYQEDNRRYMLKSRYGLTDADYDGLVRSQSGMCPICQAAPSERSGGKRAKNSTGLYVDHDHVSGKVRGLLCHKCNVALGLLGDDPTRLERAAKYLRGMPTEYLGVRQCA